MTQKAAGVSEAAKGRTGLLEADERARMRVVVLAGFEVTMDYQIDEEHTKPDCTYFHSSLSETAKLTQTLGPPFG